MAPRKVWYKLYASATAPIDKQLQSVTLEADDSTVDDFTKVIKDVRGRPKILDVADLSVFVSTQALQEERWLSPDLPLRVHGLNSAEPLIVLYDTGSRLEDRGGGDGSQTDYRHLEFQEALPKATLEDIEGSACKMLKLPGGLRWPGLKDDRIFIRPIFQTLYEDDDKLLKCGPRGLGHAENTLLLGVPGIGKSSFGLYVLWRLVVEGRPVIYEYPKGLGCARLIFGEPYRKKDVAVCIVDGVVNREGLQFITLMISSAQGGATQIYHEFKKDALCLYFPNPTYAEMAMLRSTSYSHVSVDVMKERIGRWGNVPRYVFGNREGDERLILEEAIRSQTFESLLTFAETASEDFAAMRIGFCVIHFVINEKCERIGYRWASKYVESQVSELLFRRKQNGRLEVLSDLLGNVALIPLAGTFFQWWCCVQMDEGSGDGFFKIRRLNIGKRIRNKRKLADDFLNSLYEEADERLGVHLDSQGGGQLKVHPAASIELNSADQFPTISSLGGLGVRRETKRGFAAVDFIEPSGICSKATVSTTHELVVLGKNAENGLYNIFQRLQLKTKVVPLLWLVPPLVFDKITLGSLKVETVGINKTIVSAAQELSMRIVQYAVEIPNPSRCTALSGLRTYVEAIPSASVGALPLTSVQAISSPFVDSEGIPSTSAEAIRSKPEIVMAKRKGFIVEFAGKRKVFKTK